MQKIWTTYSFGSSKMPKGKEDTHDEQWKGKRLKAVEKIVSLLTKLSAKENNFGRIPYYMYKYVRLCTTQTDDSGVALWCWWW